MEQPVDHLLIVRKFLNVHFNMISTITPCKRLYVYSVINILLVLPTLEDLSVERFEMILSGLNIVIDC